MKNFDMFYQKYRRLLYYVAYQMLSDETKAEDAVSEAFLKIFQNRNKWYFREETSAKNLAVLVTKNCVIDMMRKENRYEIIELSEEIADNSSIEDELIVRMEKEQVLVAIGALQENDQIILMLRCVHELSEKEVGKMLGISRKSVGVRLCRARKHLRSALEGKVDFDGRS